MNEHIVTRTGWTVVIRRPVGGEFIAFWDGKESVFDRLFVSTRKIARQRMKELKEHGMNDCFVSRATVELRRHR